MNIERTIILAAGMAKRLGPLTDRTSKMLLDIGNTTILENAMQMLDYIGQKEIIIITGHCREQVEEFIKKIPLNRNAKIQFVHNPEYFCTNNIFSLWLAREYLTNGFILINGDVLFGRGLINIIRYVDESFLMIDDKKKLFEEEMKVQLDKNGYLTNIGKGLKPDGCDGEYIGICGFYPRESKYLVNILDEMISQRRSQEWYEEAFKSLFRSTQIKGVSTNGLPWIEIDNFDDLGKAREEVYPEILRSDQISL